MVAVSRYATMRRFLSKLKELLRVESSYLMVKPLKQWPYHPHIGRKSGTDLARPSIVPCILHKAERERSINRRHVYTKQRESLSIAGMYNTIRGREVYQSPACIIQSERERGLSIAGMYIQSRQHLHRTLKPSWPASGLPSEA